MRKNTPLGASDQTAPDLRIVVGAVKGEGVRQLLDRMGRETSAPPPTDDDGEKR